MASLKLSASGLRTPLPPLDTCGPQLRNARVSSTTTRTATNQVRAAYSEGSHRRPPSSTPRVSSRNLEEFASPDSLPEELVGLSELVQKLADETAKDSSSSDLEVMKLKEAFGELAQDLKQKLVSSASPSPAAAQYRGSPAQSRSPVGRRDVSRGVTGQRAKPFESDLEGVIPRPGTMPESMDRKFVERSEMVAMRSKLNQKLSEANTYNRYLLREMQYKEQALKDTKAMLQAVAGEIQELARMAPPEPPRTAYGMHTPGLSDRLLKLKEAVLQQIEGVDALRLRDVPLTWFGMAEDVKVMGSFDGWTYGEQMSPESTGSMTRFHTLLKLRPGRYEVKFLVDGQWRVAPEWPTTGHGMLENNLLVVE